MEPFFVRNVAVKVFSPALTGQGKGVEVSFNQQTLQTPFTRCQINFTVCFLGISQPIFNIENIQNPPVQHRMKLGFDRIIVQMSVVKMSNQLSKYVFRDQTSLPQQKIMGVCVEVKG